MTRFLKLKNKERYVNASAVTWVSRSNALTYELFDADGDRLGEIGEDECTRLDDRYTDDTVVSVVGAWWVSRFTLEEDADDLVVERHRVIAWRIEDGWPAAICAALDCCSNQVEAIEVEQEDGSTRYLFGRFEASHGRESACEYAKKHLKAIARPLVTGGGAPH